MEHRHPPLRDQVVVITGASQGIGRETALFLARQGAAIVPAARNAEALRTLTSEIEAAGGQAEPVVATSRTTVTLSGSRIALKHDSAISISG
jgi:NADP-dependent 3-hydroxy acid dehydrogenase YdfG